MTIPKIISVDDHVIEPASVWQDRLPAKYRDAGPRLERRTARVEWVEKGKSKLVEDGGPGTSDVDVWIYEEEVTWRLKTQFAHDWSSPREIRRRYSRNGFAELEAFIYSAHCGYADEDALAPVTYDRILPGAYIQAERLAALDTNHTDASLSFPTFPRFCGQTFLEGTD